ncbi:MAG: leucine--tRNA ligase [candidate division WOR-3 bacterium]
MTNNQASFKQREAKWQKFWEEKGIFKTNPNPKRKYYVLVMYPYPSGDLHMGHVKNYVIGDVINRYRKMQGYDVLHPFGWDAFGLPAENAAIAHGIHPEKWTKENIEISKRNLKLMGIGYDWDAEVTTCEPDYYRWNQWLFLKFYERGLAYRKEAYVNWCPKCQTVLANEQVVEGHCYRSACAAPVEKKKLTQWFFKITEYAQRLLDGLDKLPHWPENVKTMQRNWIGRSEGVEVDFTLEHNGQKFPIFTTRPDTLYGVTFMALAPDAPLAETIAQGTKYEKEVSEFITRILKRPEIERIAVGTEKEGVFTGRYAINPVNGERVPIYIADFVLASYGTGMIMAVPAHDQRDFEFAKKYNIPIKVVINPPGENLRPETMTAAYVDEGIMVNSGQFNGLNNQEGIEKITDYLVAKGIGRRTVNYRLKDWLISRQRYWGTPIPMIHCERCGIVPVPEKDLPVLLPKDVKDYTPKGKSVLAGVESFINTTCPNCGGKAKRDPDTMDTFVDSSWYFFRYCDPKNDKLPFDPKKVNQWLPVDEYIGGIEHACGHLIFFRFFTKVLHDMGMVAVDEPCDYLWMIGMVKYKGAVMSSSKKHGVWVGPFVEEHGADVARLTMLFATPPEKEMDWSDELVTGVTRFIQRINRLYEENKNIIQNSEFEIQNLSEAERRLYIRLNQTIKKVITDTEAFQYNTAIAGLMEFLNDLYAFNDKKSQVFAFALNRFVLLLAPFAPHLAEELWHQIGNEKTIFLEPFPTYDEKATSFAEMTIPIQINGKLRSKLVVPVGTTEETIKKLAFEDKKVIEYTQGKTVTRIIYIPNKLLSIVTN